MSNENRTVWVVFNGELYNHHELRQTLETRGHVFRGRSDTEVLPHLYEEHGAHFVEKLRGMFAIAIYDVKSQTLYLARDRFGIKPLFYAASSKRFAFASEIGALRKLPDINDSPDEQAIVDFTALFYVPAPATFFAGIRALEPGAVLTARLAGHQIVITTAYYHKWSISPQMGLSLRNAVNQSNDLLTTAVRRQMESDVPMGALLSGGIDSSLISAAAQDASNGKLRTFNVRFPDEQYDETWAAVQAAQHIQSRHEVLDLVSNSGKWEEIAALLVHTGQPFADTSLFAVNAVCRLMREHVTVALSGDGGDEAFGGYEFYWQIPTIVHRQSVPSAVWRGIGRLFTHLGYLGVATEYVVRRAKEIGNYDDISVVQDFFCPTSVDEQRALCCKTDVLPVRRLFERQWQYHLPKNASRVERLAAHATEVCTRLELPNDFLFKVDMGSMREGLEVRVPMLDEDLFNFALTLPYQLKVHGNKAKRVLRAIADKKLPPEVANKPKKGFGIPVDTWVDSRFKDNLRDALLGSSSRLPDFFRPETYKPMVEAFCAGRSYPGISRKGLYQRAIMLLAVQLNLDSHVML